MIRIRKLAASNWWAHRYIRAAIMLSAGNVELRASGTWIDSKTRKEVTLPREGVPTQNGSLKKKTIIAIVNGVPTKLSECGTSYYYVSFDVACSYTERERVTT